MDKHHAVSVHTFEFTYDARVTSEHLGSLKYTTIAHALGELVTNAFDANACNVNIDVGYNQIEGVDFVAIRDDGDGMTLKDIEERFFTVAVLPRKGRTSQFGRFGVGRFAVYRIGNLSEWTTVSQTAEGNKTRYAFTLCKEDATNIDVYQEPAAKNDPTGTLIRITNILQADDSALVSERLTNDLLSQFCSYLLGNIDKKILVDGSRLEVDSQILEREKEVIPASATVADDTTVSHLILRRPVDRSRFPAQLLFSSKGRTVAHAEPDAVASAHYLGIAECPYLERILSANREAIIEIDGSFSSLKDEVLRCVERYTQTYRQQQRRSFIERARQEEFYPYRSPASTSVLSVRQAVYDVVLEKVNDRINLDSMTKKQQAAMFRLLNRALENEDLLVVLQQIAAVSDEEIEKFRAVLEKTTLESIIRLSHEVVSRLTFLDFLHELVYGDTRKSVKERSQLHKIIESQTWIFGSEFHLATSDQSFRTIIQRHRNKVGWPELSSDELTKIQRINDIPDLFLAAQREYPIDIRYRHLLVELKAPNVNLGRKEVEQIRRYAETILESSEFDRQSTHWDLFLVSSELKQEIEKDRSQMNKPHGVLWEWEQMTVRACTWSEIISRARQEMELVNQHLEKKSQELSVSQYLKDNYPDILDSIPSSTEGAA